MCIRLLLVYYIDLQVFEWQILHLIFLVILSYYNKFKASVCTTDDPNIHIKYDGSASEFLNLMCLLYHILLLIRPTHIIDISALILDNILTIIHKAIIK